MTGPRHPAARRLHASGLFDGLATFREFENRIAALPAENDRGTAFEGFAEAHLATQAIVQAEEALPFSTVPLSLRTEWHLPDRDAGK